MNWFFGALAVLLIAAVSFITFYQKPVTPSDISVENVETSINALRVQNNAPLLSKSAKLQTIAEDAMRQAVSRTISPENIPEVTVDYGTNSHILVTSRRALASYGAENITQVIGQWSSDETDKSSLIDPDANIMGVATGKSRNGVNVVFVLIAHCKVDC